MSKRFFNSDLLCNTDKHGRNWFSGPTFLYGSEEHWQIESINCLDQNDAKIRQAETFVGVITIMNISIDDKRYSSWRRIVRVMGWLERCARTDLDFFDSIFIKQQHSRLKRWGLSVCSTGKSFGTGRITWHRLIYKCSSSIEWSSSIEEEKPMHWCLIVDSVSKGQPKNLIWNIQNWIRIR